jgi:poly(hydroxyalkanoate) granule-associated protein
MMNIQQIRDAAQELPADVAQAGRQVWLAGLGAAGIVTTGGQAVFSMLVEEGKRVKAMKVVDLVEDVVDNALTPVKAAMKNLDETVQTTSKTVLKRFGVPSRQEVAALTARVEQLIAKVEGLDLGPKRRAKIVKKGGRRVH